MLDTYDSVIVDYSRSGVALLGAKMVTITCHEQYQKKYHKNHCESNIIAGLDLLRFSTCPSDSQHIAYMLNNNDIRETGFWQIFT